jgi:crotonobetainyl-CoA:carnitine CoA-transferase CaiB-like acyl-CoA transferase
MSTDVAGAYCSRLLATCGANVIQVEPPTGHPLRSAPPVIRWNDCAPGLVSAAYEYLAAYKRGIVLDAGTRTGETLLQELLTRTDILITSAGEGLEERTKAYRLANRRGVHVVTSPFGLSGPYAGRPSSQLIDWAMSGYLYATGDPGREPVQGPGPWCAYAAGLTAVIGAIAAALHARRTGQGQVVDVGTMESMAALHQWSFVLYTHQGVVKRRSGNRHAESHHPCGFLACKDGWVCIAALGPATWETFCLAIGMPELIADPRFATAADRFDYADELDPILERWLRQRTREEVVAHLQDHRVLAGKVLSPFEVLGDPQLAAREFWVTPQHLGAFARMPGLPFRLGSAPAFRPAPRLGEHTVDVLRGIGLDDADIERACGAGIVQAGGSR